MPTKPPILIVEDDPDALAAMASLVKTLGYTPISMASAEEALKTLDNGLIPALMIIDIKLPGISGFEFLQTLHKDLNVPPAVAITAFHSPAVVAEALEAGYTHCLRKPANLDEVTETIRTLIA